MTTLENGGIAPTADLTVNSLTATTFVETPQLQSGAGDLQIQNALVTVRKEDAGQLRRRRHQHGPGRHGAGGQHPERHHGGFRPGLRGQHGSDGASNSTIEATGLISANGGLDVQANATAGSVELSTEVRSPIVKARPTDVPDGCRAST